MNINNAKASSNNDEALFMPFNHVKGLPIQGTPNSQEKRYDNNGNIDQIRCFGNDGYVLYDYDFDDHGYPNKHNYPKHNGAHKHKWGRTEDGFPTHGDHEELSDEDYNTYIKPYLNN